MSVVTLNEEETQLVLFVTQNGNCDGWPRGSESSNKNLPLIAFYRSLDHRIVIYGKFNLQSERRVL